MCLKYWLSVHYFCWCSYWPISSLYVVPICCSSLVFESMFEFGMRKHPCKCLDLKPVNHFLKSNCSLDWMCDIQAAHLGHQEQPLILEFFNRMALGILYLCAREHAHTYLCPHVFSLVWKKNTLSLLLNDILRNKCHGSCGTACVEVRGQPTGASPLSAMWDQVGWHGLFYVLSHHWPGQYS